MNQGLEASRRYIKIGLLWMKKWNKPLVALLAVLMFSSLIVLVVVETYHDYVGQNLPILGMGNNSNITAKSNEETYRKGVNYCYVEEGTTCGVKCITIIDTAISSAVNDLNLLGCSFPGIDLNLEEVYFSNNTIVQGWLSGLTGDVGQLTISSPLLEEIGDLAFAGEPFENLESLVIANSRIKVLKKDALSKCRLRTFEFRCNNGRINIEYDALESVADYLSILQFSQCIDDFVAVRNITGTGTSIFNKLEVFDLRFNSFNVVLNNSFIDTPRLISLYLSENNIKTVELEAFKGIQRSVQLLDLKNNKLTTLPNGLFNGFTRGGQIDIVGNPWNCNCDLFWFKEFYINNLALYFKNGNITFDCTAGNYNEIDFCPGIDNDTSSNPSIEITTISTTTATATTASVTTSTVTTSAVTPPTEGPNTYVYLRCNDVFDSQDMFLEGMNRIFSHSVKVRNSTIIYNFYQIENTPYFEIKIMNTVVTDYLIWINSKNSSDYGCVYNIQESVQLTNLQYGMSYTICLLKEAADTVAPFDCTSLTVPLEWKNHAWILNKHIPAVIGGVIGVALAIILITSIIIFYTIRQNPKLIKGNKRVVIVRNKSADVLVMPNYERQRYVAPSVYTNSEGYLTPRNKVYDKINERRFRHLNTITEKYYKDFHATASRHARTSYSDSVHRRSIGSVVYEPPPLPPNHPSEKLRQSSRSRSSSNSQSVG